jgi:hypothetical protein
MGEFDARFLLKRFQLSHVYLSVLTVLCALIKYMLVFLLAIFWLKQKHFM